MYDVNSKSLYRVEGVSSGVGVSMVNAESPAQKAGLNVGDVIIAIDGVTINNVAELRVQLYKHKFGDKVKIKYVRNGQAYTAEVDLFKYTG
jgi:serine protease Do